MSTHNLSKDAIQTIIHTEKTSSPTFVPVLQIIKVIPVHADPQRFRIILSDGIHYAQGMLPTSYNDRVTNGSLGDHSIIKVTNYMVNVVQNKAVIIVLNFDIVTNAREVIGAPVDIGEVSSATSAPNGKNYSTTQNQPHNTYIKSDPVPNSYSSHNSIQRTNVPTSNKHITPITNLNMYANKWTIKGRLTAKSDIRHWSNAKGEGSLFSIDIIDSTSDIKATFFKEAVEKFYNLLEVGKVYTFSGGKLKPANVQYNTCKSDFEITFDPNSEIHLEVDSGDVVQQHYDFVSIQDLENVEPGQFVDIIGVVKQVDEPSTIISKKTGREMMKATLSVVDDSGAEVQCTVWGDRAAKAQTDFSNTPVVAFKRARVSDFGGRSLSASGIDIRPSIPQAGRIQQWWNAGGSMSSNIRSLSSSNSGGGGAGRFPKFEERKNIGAIKGENLGYTNPDKPDYISFKGTIGFIKSDRDGGAWYAACPNPEEPCKNRYKVSPNTDGSYYCERCQQTYPNCMRKFIFSATITDDTSTTWVSVFDDQAKVLLDGTTADSLYEGMQMNGQEYYEGPFVKATNTDWIFTCRVKQEMVQDEMRIKTTVQSLHPMDYAQEGRSLLNAILAM